MVGNNTILYYPELSNINGECEIGDDCKIHSHVWIGKKVKIGNRCKIEAFCFIPDGITIEDDCFIGPAVVFCNDKFPPSYGKYWSETLVKKGASIGGGSNILPGITIGEKSLIGAGSLVTNNVPAGEIWFGAPAKFVKKYENNNNG